jgi:UDP-N-acetylglucosamine/UDP-N-acetylgalactosamine diphosphorylase
MIKTADQAIQNKINLIYENKQDHVFKFWDKLTELQRSRFLSQIKKIDFTLLNKLIDLGLNKEKDTAERLNLEQAGIVTLKERKEEDDKVRAIGEEALRKSQVAAFLVAGGQGSRLGFNGPKGMFPVTPVKNKTLFQLHAEKLSAIGKKYNTVIPWYIMTSEINNEETIMFFEKNNYFGRTRDDIKFFTQDMLPAINRQGKLILCAPDRIFENPNGHGGSIKALWDSGALKDMQRRDVKYIFYFQVDNVLTQICDPVYIGYHISNNSEMSNKVVRKNSPEEKMGIICKINGKTGLVEYSDLSNEDMFAVNKDGALKYWAGNIATHLISVDFIERENASGFRLPYHKAEKSIAYITDKGKLHKPNEKNGIKFETFVFDALLDAQKTVSIEVDRRKEFSALKNKEGFNSPLTVRNDLLQTYSGWLKSADIDVPVDENNIPKLNLEISPLFALNEKEVKQKRNSIPRLYDGIYIE